MLATDAMAWTGYPPAWPGTPYGPGPMYRGPAWVAVAPPAWHPPAWPGRRRQAAPADELSAGTGASDEADCLPAALADDGLPVGQRKRLFIGTLLPLVKRENARLLGQRGRLLGLQEAVADGRSLSRKQRAWLHGLAQGYDVSAGSDSATTIRRLLRRVDVIPAGLVIAQAANESAWGRSRFARKGNNLFGIHTEDTDQGMKPKRREPGKTHLVRSYASIVDSVHDYMHNLNTHPAYRTLRSRRLEQHARAQPLSALRLAGALGAYSELGDEYVERIQDMIRSNDLEQIAGARAGRVALLD